VAAALTHGRVGIGEVGAIDDAAVLALADRIEGRAVDGAGGVSVTLDDGRSAAVAAGAPLGSPENRLSVAQLEAKFADCARYAVRPIADDTIAQAVQMFRTLETVETSSALLQLFV
jgi:2-methylcitrate dehydratase PrpD